MELMGIANLTIYTLIRLKMTVKTFFFLAGLLIMQKIAAVPSGATIPSEIEISTDLQQAWQKALNKSCWGGCEDLSACLMYAIAVCSLAEKILENINIEPSLKVFISNNVLRTAYGAVLVFGRYKECKSESFLEACEVARTAFKIVFNNHISFFIVNPVTALQRASGDVLAAKIIINQIAQSNAIAVGDKAATQVPKNLIQVWQKIFDDASSVGGLAFRARLMCAVTACAAATQILALQEISVITKAYYVYLATKAVASATALSANYKTSSVECYNLYAHPALCLANDKTIVDEEILTGYLNGAVKLLCEVLEVDIISEKK